MPLDSSQISRGLARDRTWVSTVRGRRLSARAKESTKSVVVYARPATITKAGHSSTSTMAVRPPEVLACKKLLITSRAPVPVPFLPYSALTFEKSRIPPHTSAHKHGTRKDISVLCNEGEHLEPRDVTDVHGKCGSPHCSYKYKVGI